MLSHYPYHRHPYYQCRHLCWPGDRVVTKSDFRSIWDALTAGAHDASATRQAGELLFSYITHGADTVSPSAFSQKLFSFLDSNGKLCTQHAEIQSQKDWLEDSKGHYEPHSML